jgi:hypothetical protein
MHLRAFHQALAHHHIQTKRQRLDLHPGQLANLQPNRLHPAEPLRLGVAFHQADNAFRQGHLMHIDGYP